MSQLKFKFLANAYPKSHFTGDVMLEVELERFYKKEEDYLPLFVDNQSGFYPENVPWQDFEGQQIAVLQESVHPDGEYQLIIYHIVNREMIETTRRPITEEVKPEKKVNQRKRSPRDKIHFNLPEIWQLLEQLNIDYRGESLGDVYVFVIPKAYHEFLSFAQKNTNKDWISFLLTEQARTYFELFQLLDKNRRGHQRAIKNHMHILGQQLEYFRLIRNPYRPWVEKDYDPPNQDLGSLYGFHLCLYYNNHINIDSIEAWELQERIFEEFLDRGWYLEKEPLLRKHANPIKLKTVAGKVIVRIFENVAPRFKKDKM